MGKQSINKGLKWQPEEYGSRGEKNTIPPWITKTQRFAMFYKPLRKVGFH